MRYPLEILYAEEFQYYNITEVTSSLVEIFKPKVPKTDKTDFHKTTVIASEKHFNEILNCSKYPFDDGK